VTADTPFIDCPSCGRTVKKRGAWTRDTRGMPRPHLCPHKYRCPCGRESEAECPECAEQFPFLQNPEQRA